MTPALALDYLHALSADVRAGVVLRADGSLLAGPEALVAPARALLAAAGDAAEVEVATAAGTVFAARSERHVLVVVCGRQALASLARFDLRLALDDLARGDREAA
jgi:hypothetical protein